jgi:mono/diheme cytochrome c family protein
MMNTMRRAALFAILGGVLVLASSARGEDADSRELFREGSKLWPQTCGTCHKPQPGSDRSPAEWDIIMMHMRSVANLPTRQTEAILAYLKAR